jgi:limonene-1,2-epoxide hydrolase
MSEPVELVRGFIAACERRDWAAIRAAMADDIAYHNIPMPVVNGADAAIAVLQQFMGAAEEVVWHIYAIAGDEDGRVLNERLDVFVMPGGKRIELPVAGVFEVAGGKIVVWRDYFDLADFQRQMAG